MPYLSTYAATKAFDRFFALGLAAEVARFGVKVTALCPGPTESEFFDVPVPSISSGGRQPAEEVARIGIRRTRAGPAHDRPLFRRTVTAFLVRFLPVGLITYFIEKAARPK